MVVFTAITPRDERFVEMLYDSDYVEYYAFFFVVACILIFYALYNYFSRKGD